jgi:hypothetical protein
VASERPCRSETTLVWRLVDKPIAAPPPSAARASSTETATCRGTPRAPRHARCGGSANEPALSSDLMIEIAAAPAKPQVAPHERGKPTGGWRKLLTDLGAGCLACPAACDQGTASLEDIRLHCSRLTAEDLRDLSMGEAGRLDEQQRRSMLLRQLLDVSQHVANLDLSLSDVGEVRGRASVDVLGRFLPRVTEHGKAAVPGDGEEPRFEVEVPASHLKLPRGGEESVLDDILGVFDRSEHLARKAEDRARVPFVDRLESRLVSPLCRGDEAVVAHQEEGVPGGLEPSNAP